MPTRGTDLSDDSGPAQPESQPESQPDGQPDGADVVAELTARILGEEPVYSAAEVAAESGVTLEQARRLWRALGFPESGGTRAYTPGDVAAVTSLVQAVDAGLMDFDLAVTLTRALGQTMARLADWEVGALVHRVVELAGDGTSVGGERREAARQLLDDFAENFEELMVYAWRRHLAAAVGRMSVLVDDGDSDLSTTQLTVGFADIVAFTALSNELSRDRIGDLVELFESRCADVVTSHNGRVIKTIGDSVLFVNTDAVAAYDTAEGIINVVGRDSRMPDVRLGLASGAVVLRLGDVFGPPVNLAARMTAVARRNRVIVDQDTADLLPADQFESRRLPARPMRGFGVIEPVTVQRQ